MTKVFLSLGSNLSNRKEKLSLAVRELKKEDKHLKISPLFETPALLSSVLLKKHKLIKNIYNPFLNIVVLMNFSSGPEELLNLIKKIEKKLGRLPSTLKWAPRPIDIDILFFGNSIYHSKNLTIPHKEVKNRSFILAPLKELAPNLVIPKTGHLTPLFLYRSSRLKIKFPVWMHIINATPDSFSDGGDISISSFKKIIRSFSKEVVHILDLGGESTRPGATEITDNIEWRRIKPFINAFFEHYKDDPFRPKLSIDTRHLKTIKKSIKTGADMINDVSGMEAEEEILDILASHPRLHYVLMHSLTVPAEKTHTFSSTQNPVKEISLWLENKINLLLKKNISLDRIIFDPGIGFGKTQEQSLYILKHIHKFFKFPVRIMAGHSRKSYMSPFSKSSPKQRDLESAGVSLALGAKGVDILRVHQAPVHSKIYRGFSQMQHYSKGNP